jgi:hypothetical protein
MDENPHQQQPRMRNPHLMDCPDFSGDAFAILVESMVGPDRTREQAIEGLKTAWHAQNLRSRELWDAQLLADQIRQNEPNVQNAALEEQPQLANDATDVRKKPKLGAFAATASIGNEISLKPSTFAINKLREMKYIELYCFSPAGCRDHANQRLSTADEAFGFTYGISADGSASNSLTLKPVSALAHPRKITPDEDLTWEQVRDAKACYLSHVMEAGWDRTHVDALVSFFINLDNHSYNDTPEGKQALVWYQAHAREEWHRKLGTTESFNLAILNGTLLADFKKKANDQSMQNNVTQVSNRSIHPPRNELNPTPTFTPHTPAHPWWHTTPHAPRTAPMCFPAPHAPHAHAPPAHHALHAPCAALTCTSHAPCVARTMRCTHIHSRAPCAAPTCTFCAPRAAHTMCCTHMHSRAPCAAPTSTFPCAMHRTPMHLSRTRTAPTLHHIMAPHTHAHVHRMQYPSHTATPPHTMPISLQYNTRTIHIHNHNS